MSDETDRRARFESVVAVVHDPLQRYLRRRADRDDAADAFADTLLTVWRRLDDVPADDPLPWCYGVARRCLANQRRGNQRRLRLVSRITSQPAFAHAGSTDDRNAIDPDLDADLAAALAALAPTDQEVLHLWAWEQLEPREMAVVLETSPNAASSRLSRAKRHLTQELERRHDRAPTGHSSIVRTTDTHEGEHRP